ncbi:hypothetical protein MPLDJ20_90013 [Mesorhizobium plurifarium]|uniref:Uncharacterized protein n=1 Tax=Mesorhizobium plurifarium TaxID=69974 RepID=A0A090FRE0_MESPL|nr:hypothetical protein MPLDJ20_90013 [Mesorhizobium plurifarium]
MVGRLFPAARRLQDLVAFESRHQVGGGPDMVEAAAAVRRFPVLRAIAPPSVELLLGGHVEPHQVDPASGLAHRLEICRLDRRVADDVEQLLVRPDVMLLRRDVQVADQDRCGRFIRARRHGVHLVDEIELVAEFAVDLRVRLVAAGRDVEIMHQHRFAARLHPDRQMPAVVDLAETPLFHQLDRAAGDGGDAVIALLTVEQDVLVARLAEGLFREELVRNLGLLQAEHVGRVFLQQPLDDRHAQAHGIDVPGGDGERHAASPDGKSRRTSASERGRRQAEAWRKPSRLAKAFSTSSFQGGARSEATSADPGIHAVTCERCNGADLSTQRRHRIVFFCTASFLGKRNGMDPRVSAPLRVASP